MNTAAPGISVRELLLSAKPKSVRRLLPQSTLDLVERMSPGLLDTDEVNRIATATLDPLDAIQHGPTRSEIIRLLPLSKARELCTKLELSVERSPYDAIEAKVRQVGIEPLRDFFGIIDDPRAPRKVAPTEQEAEAHYGLFPHQRDAARRVAAALSRRPRKVILHMPTGAGKNANRNAPCCSTSTGIWNQPWWFGLRRTANCSIKLLMSLRRHGLLSEIGMFSSCVSGAIAEPSLAK